MARFRRTAAATGGPTPADYVMVAVYRMSFVRYKRMLTGIEVELPDDDPAMARLTAEQRRWVRDFETSGEDGFDDDRVERHWGPLSRWDGYGIPGDDLDRPVYRPVRDLRAVE